MIYKPGEQYIVSDNVEAIKIIVGQGVLHLLKPRGTANTAYYSFETEHHWCNASNHIGQEKECDNGYMVFMIPKSKMNKEEACKFIAECIIQNSDALSFGWETVPPLKHN